MPSKYRFSIQYPHGVFKRGRTDWAIEKAMAGAVSTTPTGAFMPLCSLYNDSQSGTYLAVMALLAWTSGIPPVAQAEVAQGTASLLAGKPQPLIVGNPTFKGQLYTDSTAGIPTTTPMYYLLADGRSWLTLDGAPLAVLAPGSRFEVFYGVPPSGAVTRPSALAVTFIWVPY